MPEAKHYSDEVLNRAFVYSNIQSISIKREIYNPNIIKSFSSKIKEEYATQNEDVENVEQKNNDMSSGQISLDEEYKKQ